MGTSVTPPPTPLLVASPTVINADTTYGLDTSEAGNYGLGPNYQSPLSIAAVVRGEAARPSWWWLVIALVALAVLG